MLRNTFHPRKDKAMMTFINDQLSLYSKIKLILRKNFAFYMLAQPHS